ncbi:cyclase family protein [Neobacillus kokaensis]|uniref:Cyclase n=1 Tax=Neobacillus kokaensis TaxID=2759023 RepID=A0ABQ3NA52_9BACI|nr:cyclase family protein [Neobacillus kokaensis]GHH98651.1 cyclase [Neobacillus kokaensis]
MFKDKKMIDLTLELYEGLQSWDIHPKVVLMDYHVWWMNKDRYEGDCQGFSTKLFAMTDHTGTHVDAQRHFYPEGDTIEKYPVDKMMGTAVLLDVSFRSIDQPISAKDLEKALEIANETIEEDDILIVSAWPHSRSHNGFNTSPGLTPDAVNWLLEKKIKLFATDLATVDLQDMSRYAHCSLLKANIPIVENLINLEKIQQPRFDFIGLPLRLRGATGSPIRAVAFVD